MKKRFSSTLNLFFSKSSEELELSTDDGLSCHGDALNGVGISRQVSADMKTFPFYQSQPVLSGFDEQQQVTAKGFRKRVMLVSARF